MKPESVRKWREALVMLSDQHFFDLVRMYVGAVKTPYNKQRLVEDVSAFLRKAENRNAIIASLSTDDRMLLSAIRELAEPDRQQLVRFFEGTWRFPEVYERILNLEERLVIYRSSDDQRHYYALNPLLEDDMLPLLGRHTLVYPVREWPIMDDPPAMCALDDGALAGFVSFFMHEDEPLRNDGSFKKRVQETLSAVFPYLGRQDGCYRHLSTAMQNLALLVRHGTDLQPDMERLSSFASLSPLERIAWIVAAASGRHSRDILRGRAQSVIDCISALENGMLYEKSVIYRLYVLSSQTCTSPIRVARPHSRFSALLREHEAAASDEEEENSLDIPSLLIVFGILQEKDGLFCRASALLDESPQSPVPPLVVSPAGAVTLLPGWGLASLLPVVSFLESRSIQLTGDYELTRKSVMAAFDSGITDTKIIELLERHSGRPVPGNIKFSVLDWYRSWASLSLYHGYVLRLDADRLLQFENTPELYSLVAATLADGVYILNASHLSEVQDAFSAAGFDPVPSLGRPTHHSRTVSVFPQLRAGNGLALPGARGAAPDDTGGAKIREALLSSLEELRLPPDQHEALLSRIERKIIIAPAQLVPESVRIEKTEARGMDFLGKVRIAEQALAAGSLLEVVFDEQNDALKFLGRPLSLEKRTGDVLVTLELEETRRAEVLSLGRALVVKRIRGSIFSEPVSR